MKDVEANVVNFGRDQSICSASNSLILVANAINLIRWDGFTWLFWYCIRVQQL